MDSTLSVLDAHVESHLTRRIEDTIRLCAQPSISTRGEGMRACAAMVEEMLCEHGAQVTVFETPGNPILVGRMAGASERTLLFYNHYDVQPPEPLDLWTTPPFEPEVRDGRLYGRGTKDDKGEFVARLAAVDAVRAAHGGELPCSVLFVVEGEEEISSPNIRLFVEQHRDVLRCDGSVWEEGGIGHDGQPVVSLGARGILAVELAVRTLARDAHSGGGHIMPSAAWRLIWAIHTLKGQDERVRIPAFYDDALPPSPVDLDLLQRQFAKNPDYEEKLRATYGIREFAGARSGLALLQSVFEPTCNVQGIAGGYQGPGVKTIVPGEARAKLDFRLVPNQDPEDIFRKLRLHLDAGGFPDVETRMLGWMRPARTAPDDPLVDLTVRSGRAVYGGESTLLPMSGGSSPIYAFQGPLGGIPVVTAGVGYWDNRTHAPDEHIRLQDFHSAIRHLARIIEGFAGIWP